MERKRRNKKEGGKVTEGFEMTTEKVNKIERGEYRDTNNKVINLETQIFHVNEREDQLNKIKNYVDKHVLELMSELDTIISEHKEVHRHTEEEVTTS